MVSEAVAGLGRYKTELTDGLRALRLWHWQQVLAFRSKASRAVSDPYDVFDQEKAFNSQADFHIKQVQLLNDFFPVDDTAEADANPPTNRQAASRAHHARIKNGGN